jgi:hypothetical protein
MSEFPSTTAELREKLKSKMDVAKFFAGFITLFIAFLLNGGKLTSPFSKIGIAFLISSLVFCVAAVSTYDHLLTPRKYWVALSEKEREEDRFQDRLLAEMVRSWWWLFVPAVGCFGIGFFLVLVQELGIKQPPINVDVAGGLILAVLLVAAVALPIWIAIAKWPRIR